MLANATTDSIIRSMDIIAIVLIVFGLTAGAALKKKKNADTKDDFPSED